jgi:hypothetical protein
MTRKKETPFVLKWKEEQEDPHQRETENTPTNVVNKGTQLKAAGSTKRHEETQDQIGKPLPTTTTDQNNVPPRTSNRIKKTPTTMNKDFLWIKGPPTRVNQ